MNERDVEVWMFYPHSMKQSASGVRRTIKLECRKRGWTFQERPTRLVHSDGRPLGTIKPRDATNLYKRLHRARVGVWQIGCAHTPTNPQPHRNAKDYVRLHRFVLHKAFHCNVQRERFDESWPNSLVAFQKWLDRIGCENESDPRCLPFHVFDTKFRIDDLATSTGRSEFAADHGSQSSRVDSSGLRWGRPGGGGHGREILHVAGYDLDRGFHWDVSNSASKRRLTTTSDVWEIRRRGYVNVYPDAHVRKGKLTRQVKLTKKAKAR